MGDELALADGREAIAVGIADPLGGAGGERGEEKVGAGLEHELARIGEPEQALARDEVPRSDPDLVHQEGFEIVGDVPVHGEPDDVAAAPFPQQALELAHEVFGFLLDLDVAVAQHPAYARVLDAESGEQPVHEHADDLLHRNEAGRIARKLHEPRDALGDGDESEHRVLRIAGASDHQAEAEVGNEREGMRGVARDGREDGENLRHEVFVEPRPVRAVELGFVEHEDVVAPHFFHQRLPAALLAVHQGMGPVRDGRELLGRGHAVLAGSGDAGLHLAAQAGDPHHVELVEVGRGDGEKPHPLEQRHPRIARFLEHPLVECEPREFAVDEALGRVGFDC